MASPVDLAPLRAALDLDAAYAPDAVAAMHNAAPALRAALDELERLRADARRHADARAELFTAYLRGSPSEVGKALYAFFIATEEP